MPTSKETPPKHYAVLIYPGFQALDVFGTLDVLNTHFAMLPADQSAKISLVSHSLAPVPTGSGTPPGQFYQTLQPTHTLASPPSDVDVLFVPGGLGCRNTEVIAPYIQFIREYRPKIKYLYTVCTGSAVVAQAGVLDGKKATGNKASWKWLVTLGKGVNWIHQARWVVDDDGTTWTSSGVTAGMDMAFTWMTHFYGESKATLISEILEYERHTDRSWDPYAKVWEGREVDDLFKDEEAK